MTWMKQRSTSNCLVLEKITDQVVASPLLLPFELFYTHSNLQGPVDS